MMCDDCKFGHKIESLKIEGFKYNKNVHVYYWCKKYNQIQVYDHECEMI